VNLLKINWVLHNSHESFFRSPFGAAPCNQKIVVRIMIHTKEIIDSVLLNVNNDDNKEEKLKMVLHTNEEEKKIYEAAVTTPSSPGLLWYYFSIHCGEKTYYYGNNPNHFGGEGVLSQNAPLSYQITVYEEGASTPEWFKEAIMYQIFPDRFYNGLEQGGFLATKKNSVTYANWDDIPLYIKYSDSGAIARWDFFGGNLLGVIKKLPYLKSLGINVIYFNPIFESASNHRYDTADYKKIDPMLGDVLLFQELYEKTQEMGMHIILDGVFSHTGSDSIYFNKEENYSELGAYQSKASPYYSWYRFNEYPNKYESWWGIDTMPNTNEMDPSFQDFILGEEDGVIAHWMQKGVKGWRLDVVDELPHVFVKKLRKTMKKIDENSILIGEVWEDASNKISYGERREYLLGEELDSVMNYPFRRILLDFFLDIKDAVHTHNALMSLYENYPKHNFFSNMNLIGSHDVPRILTLLGEAPDKMSMSQKNCEQYRLSPEQRKLAISRLKLLSLFQMTFPGVPCIYYGDEIGMEGFEDPLNRLTYPWGQENEEILNWYQRLTALRNKHEVLRRGEWHDIAAKGDVYGYARQIKGGELALILFNRSKDTEYTIFVDLSQQVNRDLKDMLNQDEKFSLKNGTLEIILKPLEGKLLIS
jgi:cyclomaltodextrinase / maltogenic alpha-amylase / neopullulanase